MTREWAAIRTPLRGGEVGAIALISGALLNLCGLGGPAHASKPRVPFAFLAFREDIWPFHSYSQLRPYHLPVQTNHTMSTGNEVVPTYSQLADRGCGPSELDLFGLKCSQFQVKVLHARERHLCFPEARAPEQNQWNSETGESGARRTVGRPGSGTYSEDLRPSQKISANSHSFSERRAPALLHMH
jgi:hypothetical protein